MTFQIFGTSHLGKGESKDSPNPGAESGASQSIPPSERQNVTHARIGSSIENHRMIIPQEREVITIWMNNRDMSLHCSRFGQVHDWTPRLHRSHGYDSTGFCVHRLEPMPTTQLLCPDWISKLGWQPQVFGKHAPVIASRVGDTVTLAFNAIGTVEGCQHQPVTPENRWSYKLYRMRWWDEDAPSDNVLLGVRTVSERNS